MLMLSYNPGHVSDPKKARSSAVKHHRLCVGATNGQHFDRVAVVRVAGPLPRPVAHAALLVDVNKHAKSEHHAAAS